LYLTMSGGMWSVTLTDTLQAFILLITVVVLAYAMMKSIGGGSAIEGVRETWQETEPDFRTLLPETYWLAWLAWTATLTNGILGNIPGQDLMQRVFASRSAQTAMWACLLAGVIYILFGLAPVMLGLASRQVLPEGQTDGVLHALAQLHLNPLMQIVFTLSLLSIVVSTATSALLSPSALLAHNVLGHWDFFNRRKLLTDRGTVFVSALVSLPMALLSDQVLELLAAALAVGLVALVVPFLGGFFGRPRGEMPGLLSVTAGIAVWVAHGLLGWWILPNNLDPSEATLGEAMWLFPSELTGLAASAIGYFVGQAIEKWRSGSTRQDVGN
jgi:solute:Na+ symporter, SSS family